MNILLIGSDYLSSLSSNGACMRNLSKEFVRRGHQVTVISSGVKDNLAGEIRDGVDVRTIKHPYFTLLDIYTQTHKGALIKYLFIIARILHGILVFFSFPNTACRRTRRVTSMAKRLVNEQNIGLVLCTSRPTDSIYAGMSLKKTYPELNVISYHFDILSSNNKSLVSRYKRKKELCLLNQELSLLNKVLIPESADFKISSSNRLKYIGFPMYIPSGDVSKSVFAFKKDCINICYIGSLDKNNRNIEYCLRLIEKVNVNMDIKPLFLHIWGRLMDPETAGLIEDCKYTLYHGSLDSKDCGGVMEDSDYLLNIGNGVTFNLIPSKIFQLFASGRPIINIKRNPQDCTERYFEKYNDAITIKEYNDNLVEDATALSNFCSVEHVKSINTNVFLSYTPSYISDIILQC